jgi:hypothetical protein
MSLLVPSFGRFSSEAPVGHDCSLEYMKRIQFLILTRPDTTHSLVHEKRGGLLKDVHPESLRRSGLLQGDNLFYSCSRQTGHRQAATLGSLLSVPFFDKLNGHLMSVSGLAVHRITAFWLVTVRPLSRRPNCFILGHLGNSGRRRL